MRKIDGGAVSGEGVGAEVGGADFRGVANGGGVAAGDDAAVDQDGNAVGQSEDGLHVVLDQQDAVVGAKAAQERDQAFGFLGAGTGQGFVEQKQGWLGGQGDGEFELALFAVGGGGGEGAGAVG